jgi:hypothetical protein
VPVRCPYCNIPYIQWSTLRATLELSVLTLLALRPFRCDECDHHFYAFTSPTDSIPSNTAASRSLVPASWFPRSQ